MWRRIRMALALQLARSVIRLQRLTHDCRYGEKPAEPNAMCELCAHKGGWTRCSRARAMVRDLSTAMEAAHGQQ